MKANHAGVRAGGRVFLALCLALFLLQGGPAWAASFEVSPVRVALSAVTPSSLLAVRNSGIEPLRFHVTVFAWTQAPAGDMVLAPTDEIVVFPTMFSLKPGETRNLRVGSAAPFAAVEQTYRVFVEELPPLDVNYSSSAIRVRMRWGIPVFRGPATGSATPVVDGLSASAGHVSFAVRNTGTTFFFARHVRLVGLAPDGTTVFSRELPAWYVLAGSLRAYTEELPDGACKAARLQVDVELDGGAVHESAPLPKSACAR
jgi:fimbrial chaperone protein